MDQYLSMFIDEAREHLQSLNDHLLQLESNPSDIQIVHTIFRSAHTLKGMSATMGFDDLASLTHEMENVLDLVRNGQLQMSVQISDLLFRALDYLEEMVEDIIQGGTGKRDVTDVVQLLQQLLNGGDITETAESGANISADSLDEYQYSILLQSIQSDHSVYYLEVHLQEQCVLKAARAYMVFDALEQNGEIVQSSPSVEEIEQENFELSFTVYYISQRSAAEIEELIMRISEIDRVVVQQLNEELLKARREAASTAEAPQAEPKPADSSLSVQQASSSEPNTAQQRQSQAPVTRTIRVDLERLDALMNLFSELLIDRVRLEVLAEEIKRSDLTETVEHMARVSSDLQNIVLNLRMMPIESVFNRFPRMIRDIARSLGKKVSLNITGADTELDRTVIDEIGDPLVHLLRNSLDHGLESAEERIRAGKPETGTIHLRAYHSGNHVFIEIEDDGRGIDRNKIIRSAIEKQLIDEDQAHSLSDQEVYSLLFHSGFSTAKEISDLSGRGVGLDVVKSKIMSLGGEVSVESTIGVGTKFTVQLPLTLSIISAMLFYVSYERYAIPLSSIVETAIIPKENVKKVHGMDMITFRDHLIPLVYLQQLLDCPPKEEESDELNTIIIRKGDKLAALAISEFIGQQDIVLKSLGNYLSRIFAVSGATILGDGQVALIIDPNSIVED